MFSYPLYYSILVTILIRHELRQALMCYRCCSGEDRNSAPGQAAPLQLAPGPQCSFFPFNFCKTDQLSKCKSFSCNTFSVSRVYSFHFHLPCSGRNFSFVLMQESHASMGPWRMEAPKCVLMIALWHTRDSTAAYRIGN